MAKPAQTRLAMILVIGLVCVIHWRAAALRSTRLLEHDEAITLLAAAGKTVRADSLYEGLADRVRVVWAESLHALLRPTGDTGAGDVLRSLAARDRHPPLYFLVLHGLQRIGVDSYVVLRLAGSLMILLAAWAAGRWVFPEAAPGAKLLGLVWLTATPVMIETATELRQYALVTLGTLLSFAAMCLLHGSRGVDRRTIGITAVAPAVLLWSQYGTAVWIAAAVVGITVLLAREPRARWRTVGAAGMIAALLLLPLLLWGLPGSSGMGPAPSIALSRLYPDAVRPILQSVGQAYCSLPGRWFGSGIWPAVGALVLLLSGTVALRQRRLLDGVLWCAALGWGAAWITLLATGQIPPHAVSAKHIAPLVLCPVVLLLRATASESPVWMRRLAACVIAASLATHVLGDWQLLAGGPEQRALIASLRSTDCLVLSAPKRGYVLPLAAMMKPDARVIIADPVLVDANWERFEAVLPRAELVFAEVDPYPGSKWQRSLRVVLARLHACYEESSPLWRGPRRTITRFRRRVAAPGAE